MDDYLLPISVATKRLSRGMWGGVNRPDIVYKLKKLPDVGSRAKVGFARWRERAAERIREAACSGQLPVYSRPDPHRFQPRHESSLQLVLVPLEVLNGLLPLRGGLPDQIDRLNYSLIRREVISERQFAWLLGSSLALKVTEFNAWYKRERARGLWPSQQTEHATKLRRKRKRGRPRKSIAIKDVVKTLAQDEAWNVEMGVSELLRLLCAERSYSVVNHDTLTRLVDELFDETGLGGLDRRREGSEPLDWLFDEIGEPGDEWREAPQRQTQKVPKRRIWRKRRRAPAGGRKSAKIGPRQTLT